ncbi:MAG TPA: TonB-dependent receptor, partial [Candidatus Acidoferrales bacterium]|nr:TonB-dependent receptor [Candidatus Acidoferrales bacterium]
AVLRDTEFFDQFGGSVGGPIWKNKIFAFFDYETVRSPQAQTNISNQWADTAAFDGSAPSGSIAAQYLTFPGSAIVNTGINASTCANAGLTEGVNCVTISGQGLDLGSPLTTGLGTQDTSWTSTSNPGIGGGFDGVADIANYITASTSRFSKAQYNGRLDADVTANDHLTFAIYWVPQSTSSLNGPARQYNFFNHSQVNDSFSLIWNHTFSPTLLNEFRVNAAGWRWNEVASNPQSPVGLPSDRIDAIGSIPANGIAQFGPNVGSILNQWTYSYKDVATKVLGRHTIKFGGELTRLYYLQDCAACGVPSYNFFNIWDFLNDAPHQEGGSFDPSSGTPTTVRQDQRENLWGFFVQDDFKLRRNLTINAGLRWSYFSPLSSKEGNMFAAIPGAGANFLTGLTVQKGNSWNAQKDNFGPEIGFAWSPGMFHDKFVLRGGYGLNYNQEEIAISAGISSNPGLVIGPSFTMSTPTSPNPGIVYAVSSGVTNLYGFPANPNAVATFGPNGLPTTGQVNVSIFPRDLPTMRTHHYSLEGEYDLGHDTIATLGYQGTLSRDIFFHENPNAVPAAEGLTLNPQIGGGDYWGVSGRGNYNALLAELNHKFSTQFSADAQFMWSKSMDTSSGPYFEQPYPFNLNLDYGPSDYNVGKAFKLFGVWQPRIFRGENAWMEKVFGGWSISGDFNMHSGFPWSPLVSVAGGSLYCGTCGYGQLFPASFTAKPGTSTSNDAFKTEANSNFPNGGAAYFAVPTYTAYSGTTYGSALPQAPGVHRNSLVGPGYKAVDAELAKGFGFPSMPVLREGAKLEFEVDAYNLFNNLNFNPGSISNNINNANFGTMTNALAGRIVTLGARFSF